MPLDRLAVRMRQVAAHLAAGMCEFLLLLAEFDRRGGPDRWECRSAAHWLSWQCGVGPTAAREQVRVARRLADMPLVTQAFAEGRISYSKVRAISRVCTAGIERQLLDLAAASTAHQLERMCSALRRSADRAAEEAAVRSGEFEAEDERFLRMSRTERGSVRGTFQLPAAAAEVLERALGVAVAQDASAEFTPMDSRGVDGLVAIAESFLARPPGAERPLPEVVVHVDLAALQVDEPTEPTGFPIRTEGGVHLSARSLARMAGDAHVRVVADLPGGAVLDLGRRSRTVSPVQFRALLARDGHCRFPGCASRHRLHAHHIVWWILGGCTDMDNLLLLCRKHHHAVHDRGWTCSGTAGAPVFRRPGGRVVGNEVTPEPAPVDGSVPRATAHSPGGEWQGDRVDWDCFSAAFHRHLEGIRAGAGGRRPPSMR